MSFLYIACVLYIVYRLWYKLMTRQCPRNVRLDGKTVIVTGAETGIGKETVRELAMRGARVIMGCWDIKHGMLVRNEISHCTGNKNIYALVLDQGSLASVRHFVQEVRMRESHIHVLINNAGALNLPKVITKDGLLYEMQVNYFGPFLLTILLIDILRHSAPSRIINVSSIEHIRGSIDPKQLNSSRQLIYPNSKLALLMFSNELAHRLNDTGITSNALHPGVAKTDIVRNFPPWLKWLGVVVMPLFFMSVEEAAQTSVYLATAKEVAVVSGKYFENCQESCPSRKVKNAVLSRALWNASVRHVALKSSEVDIDII